MLDILNGGMMIFGGTFKAIGGVGLTAASVATSASIITVSGIGAGVVTASAGASDIKQGFDEIRLGIKGDSSTVTTNGMCDMLYDGNEKAYHTSTGIAAMAGMELIPYVPLKGQTPMRAEPGTVAKNAARDTSDAALGSAAETVDTAAIKSAGTEVGSGVESAVMEGEVESNIKTIQYSDYDAIYQNSIHNAGKEEVMLGKYDGGSATSYITKAGNNYEYFDLGSDWNRIKDIYGFTDEDMFSLFNEAFLDDGINAGKTFRFSHNPVYDRGALGKEYQYLLRNNYIWDAETMTMRPEY